MFPAGFSDVLQQGHLRRYDELQWELTYYQLSATGELYWSQIHTQEDSPLQTMQQTMTIHDYYVGSCDKDYSIWNTVVESY